MFLVSSSPSTQRYGTAAEFWIASAISRVIFVPFSATTLAGDRAYHILCQNTAGYTVFEHQLLIELIASDFRQVIAPGIKEHARDQTLRTVHRERLAGTDLLVQL